MPSNHSLTLAFSLSLALSCGVNLSYAQPLQVDEDGFIDPLQHLTFNNSTEQDEFERSTFAALEYVSDPLEGINRRIYHFNYRFDQWVYLPIMKGYVFITPKPVRSGVSNFFSNLGEILTLVNSLLQFKGKRAMNSTARFLFNTTFGIGGLWDPASKMGLPKQKEDFGQTLGFYGVPHGPYLMLPFLGPSNLRDTTGLVSDYSLENYVNALNVAKESKRHPEIYVLEGVDKRYTTNMRYGQLNSPFEYEQIRYVYTKARELQIAE